MGFFYETHQSAHRIFYLKLESYKEIGIVYKKKMKELVTVLYVDSGQSF